MKLMLDKEAYISKPTVDDIKYKINKYIIYNKVDIKPQQLAKEVTSGKSFVAGYFNTKVNGQLKRRKENWSSQQIICLDFDDGMTLDEAIKEFKNEAMFIYTTFSHTDDHHKFRVVFATDKVIKDYDVFSKVMNCLLNKYPMADKQCKDGTRLFFGGNNLIEFDYNNRLIINDYLNDGKSSDNTVNNKLYIYEGRKGVNNRLINNKFIRSHQKPPIQSDNVKLIKERNIKALQDIIKPEPKIFYTYTEVYDYISKQDLGVLLGLSGTFNCLFHDDSSPSANTFYGNEVDSYIYKCFSDKCTFKTGTVRKCVERLLDCNKVESLNFLMELYKIELCETEWQKQQKEIIEENIRYLKSTIFQQEYPELYKRVGRYIGDLILLHTIAKDNLPAEHYSEEQIEFLFFASMRHLANIKGVKSPARIVNVVALFVYLGLIFRKDKDNVPKKLLDQTKKLVDPKQIDAISFFALPSYSDNIMTFGEEKAIEFKEKQFTMKGWSREMLLRALGEKEADRVYPSQKGKKVSKLSDENVGKIESAAMGLISEKGWIIEKELEEKVVLNVGGKEYKKKQIKRMIGEMIDKYGLERKRLNKKLKKELGVDVEGYPFVIFNE